MSLRFLVFLLFSVFYLEASLIKNEQFDGIESRLETLNETNGKYDFSFIMLFGKIQENKSTKQEGIEGAHTVHKQLKRVYQKYGKLYQLGLQLENILKQESAHSSNSQNGMDRVSLKGFVYINFIESILCWFLKYNLISVDQDLER